MGSIWWGHPALIITHRPAAASPQNRSSAYLMTASCGLLPTGLKRHSPRFLVFCVNSYLRNKHYDKNRFILTDTNQVYPDSLGWLVSWCFKPSQPQRIMSGMRQLRCGQDSLGDLTVIRKLQLSAERRNTPTFYIRHVEPVTSLEMLSFPALDWKYSRQDPVG